MKTRPPSPELRAARVQLRRALEAYSAALLSDLGLRANDPQAADVVANLRASDDAAQRAATVAGITES